MVKVTGGDKLESFFRKLSDNLSKAESVEIGFLENATYPDGTNVAAVAAIQEYGAPKVGIPPRPFFRNMIAKESGHWGEDIVGLFKESNYDAKKTLEKLGAEIAAELKTSITETNDPALSPVTVMLRGMRRRKQFRDLPFHELMAIAVERVKAGKTSYQASTKPLVDTGVMLKSVDFVVK